MGSCFGKKPSSMSGHHLEKADQSAFREFSNLATGNNASFNQNKRVASQQQQQQNSKQMRALLNNNSVSTNSTSTNSGANSAASSNFIHLQQHHVLNADSLVGSSVTNSSSIMTSADEQLIKTSSEANPTNKFNKNAYIALFDYAARTIEDLSFKKGDILYVNEQDKKSDGWWLARLRTATSTSSSASNQERIKCGYIPANYVAELDSVESEPWYFGNTKRMEAEKLLMLDHNQHGSYLIRISDGSNHAYSLSVRDNDSVKHYRIRRSDEDGNYFITKRVTFVKLTALVDYYSKKPDGLWVQLMKPCVKIDQPITEGLTHSFIKDFEVDRKLFVLERKIG